MILINYLKACLPESGKNWSDLAELTGLKRDSCSMVRTKLMRAIGTLDEVLNVVKHETWVQKKTTLGVDYRAWFIDVFDKEGISWLYLARLEGSQAEDGTYVRQRVFRALKVMNDCLKHLNLEVCFRQIKTKN